MPRPVLELVTRLAVENANTIPKWMTMDNDQSVAIWNRLLYWGEKSPGFGRFYLTNGANFCNYEEYDFISPEKCLVDVGKGVECVNYSSKSIMTYNAVVQICRLPLHIKCPPCIDTLGWDTPRTLQICTFLFPIIWPALAGLSSPRPYLLYLSSIFKTFNTSIVVLIRILMTIW